MSITVQCPVHFSGARHGRKQMVVGTKPAVPLGHIPRVSRLMALAIRFDGLLRAGEVQDYADLARLGHVTRARISQVMNLLNLAPDIQEELLFLPTVTGGREPVKEWQVRPIAAVAEWGRQREMWGRLVHAKF
ncbi:MAG TPA: hypothetical protein VGN72_10640 [Tepidisphaeraceae bacterium]|jgi:hypothetical protein|nr:hypothetical protein [Tepidisphaeraceae bacterium]